MFNSLKLSTFKYLPALVLAIGVSPIAQAGMDTLPVIRDSGVGHEIAAQGNQALRAIRAELLRNVRALRPTLPAQPLPVSAPTGSASSLASGQRCAS